MCRCLLSVLVLIGYKSMQQKHIHILVFVQVNHCIVGVSIYGYASLHNSNRYCLSRCIYAEVYDINQCVCVRVCVFS